MKQAVQILLLYLTVTSTRSKSTYEKLLIVSFDGFRYDYLDKNLTPYLYSLKASSSYANGLLNVFPTQTFVNHFSIATGLYSEVHGVIGNTVFDRKAGKLLDYGYDLFHYNRDVTPIWTLNQMTGKGRHSGVMMWPGSQFEYRGVSSTFVNKFNLTEPWERRISSVVSWFTHPKTPANLVLMYFEEPDDEGHASGPAPDSPQTRERLRKLDRIAEFLFTSLKDNSLMDVNVVLLSDHGMEAVTLDRLIDLNKFVGGRADMYGTSPVLQVYPKKGQSDKDVFNRLNEAAAKNKHFKIYQKANIPEHLYLKDCERTPPLLAVAEPTYGFQDYIEAIQWQIANKGAHKNGIYGIHGYDPLTPSMQPFFLARGPLFKENYSAGQLKTIDLFSLFADVLNLELPSVKPNGSLAGVKGLFKSKH